MVPYIDDLRAASIATCIESASQYVPRHKTVEDDFWINFSGADTIVTVALDIARASQIPLYSLEMALDIILGKYFNMLDLDLNSGGRSITYLPRFPAI